VDWLQKKFEHALNRRDTAKKELTELVQLVNPNIRGDVKYSVSFFRSQWADQVRVGLDHSEESEEYVEGQKKLAEFWENEEILENYQYVLILISF
jgi:cellulose biosynthesis protein BcsQ